MSRDCRRIFAATCRASSIGALVVGFVLNAIPMAAAQSPAAAPPTSWLGALAPTLAPAQTKSPCERLDQQSGEQLDSTGQRFAKQLYDNARLPQPYHGVLSSNVLPAEGLSRLTIDSKVNEVQQSCVLAFLVDDTWGLKNLRRLHFRSVNVDTFKDTSSGTESTRIFFSIPDGESPPLWFYKSATLILGAYPRAETRF